MASIKIDNEEVVGSMSAIDARWRFQVWFMSLTIRLLLVISAKLSSILCSNYWNKLDKSINDGGLEFIKATDEIFNEWESHS